MLEKRKMTKKTAVKIDKDIRGGTPCVAGTRIPVENIVFLYKKKKVSPYTIALKYYTQISVDQVKKTIEWFNENKNKYGMAL